MKVGIHQFLPRVPQSIKETLRCASTLVLDSLKGVVLAVRHLNVEIEPVYDGDGV